MIGTVSSMSTTAPPVGASTFVVNGKNNRLGPFCASTGIVQEMPPIQSNAATTSIALFMVCMAFSFREGRKKSRGDTTPISYRLRCCILLDDLTTKSIFDGLLLGHNKRVSPNSALSSELIRSK
jgi:hypothetical protein